MSSSRYAAGHSPSRVAMSREHEQETSYQRREYIEPARSRTTYTSEIVPARTSSANTKSTSKQQLATSRNQDTTTAGYTSSEDENNFEQWTVSKRKVNHKTRQVETRVSRQLLVEDGRVIADSGPQVTTRIKEDNKVEECEKEKTPKSKQKFHELECAQEVAEGESSGRVLGEKKEIQRKSREVREENMQYHDERFQELTGHDVHRRAIKAPHELITITDDKHHDSAPRGKMVHYSNKGKKYKDTDEILEVAKLAIDGSVTKEVKRTHHHEECSEDEKPDEHGEAEQLRHDPVVERSSRRHVDYVNDFDDIHAPEGRSSGRGSAGRRAHSRDHEAEDEAFPRYQIDPLLNSLRDEDFGRHQAAGRQRESRAGAGRQLPVQRRREDSSQSSSSESDDAAAAAGRRRNSGGTNRHQVHHSTSATRVEIPDEVRRHKQKLLTSKRGGGGAAAERSVSPQQRARPGQRREDASVQAHLTDEELDRRSFSSADPFGSHEKTTKQLQRQSNRNSSRRYYYGDQEQRRQQQKQPTAARRRNSLSSSSSSLSSIGDTKERARAQGTRSRDSGFKSPHQNKHEQVYSVSNKTRSKHRDEYSPAASPTPTNASHRSVKTSTTTMSAGLADRPMTPERRRRREVKDQSSGGGGGSSSKGAKVSSKPPSPFQKFAQLFAPTPSARARHQKAAASAH